ncbi:MAG TPA: hypothetical protein ENK50_05505 [Sedimenticola sp.]|nr:hypothetical protein [Sedimenticola sp.]
MKHPYLLGVCCLVSLPALQSATAGSYLPGEASALPLFDNPAHAPYPGNRHPSGRGYREQQAPAGRQWYPGGRENAYPYPTPQTGGYHFRPLEAGMPQGSNPWGIRDSGGWGQNRQWAPPAAQPWDRNPYPREEPQAGYGTPYGAATPYPYQSGRYRSGQNQRPYPDYPGYEGYNPGYGQYVPGYGGYNPGYGGYSPGYGAPQDHPGGRGVAPGYPGGRYGPSQYGPQGGVQGYPDYGYPPPPDRGGWQPEGYGDMLPYGDRVYGPGYPGLPAFPYPEGTGLQGPAANGVRTGHGEALLYPSQQLESEFGLPWQQPRPDSGAMATDTPTEQEASVQPALEGEGEELSERYTPTPPPAADTSRKPEQAAVAAPAPSATATAEAEPAAASGGKSETPAPIRPAAEATEPSPAAGPASADTATKAGETPTK